MKINTRKILEHSSKSIQMGRTFNMPHPPTPRNVITINPAENCFSQGPPQHKGGSGRLDLNRKRTEGNVYTTSSGHLPQYP